MRYTKTKATLIFALALICICNAVSATDILSKAKPLHGKDTTLVADGVISVADTVLLNSSGWEVRNVRNIVTLKIDEFANLILPDSFKVTVIYKTDYKIWPATNLLTRFDTAILIYNKNKPYTNKIISARPGAYFSSVTIKSIVANYSTAPLNSFIKSLMFENEIYSSRDYTNFDCNANAIQSLNINTDSITSTGELIVTWPTVLEADEYDLEWSVIDQSAIPNYYISSSNTNPDPIKIFDNNATRVSLSNNRSSYRIPLIYEKGTILFVRIRPVQVLAKGQRKEAFWSSVFSGGMKRFDITGGLEPSKNWQSTTSFAEEGKRKSVVQFYDGSLRSRQTVTKDNVRNTTVVAETFYDYQGRAQIQVLPSPTLNRIIAYTPNFNPDINGAEYDKDHFDKDISTYCNSGTDPLGTSSGAGNYYSSQNPEKALGMNKFIPDAKGYPFTETKYTQDGTGRIAEQSGVGAYHQLGQAVQSDASSAGHQTKYFYNTADQEDLDALFGTEVGNASHYFKNTVRDANGQYSVSYVDMHGRTIATALSGTPASSKLDKIASNNTRWETKNLLSGGNIPLDKYTVQSTKSFVVTKTGPYSFNYSLLGDSITVQDCINMGICYDCQYDLEISITNECNGTPTVYRKSNFTLADFLLSPDTTCDAPHNIIWQKDTTLTEGSYIVTKKLMISREALNAYKEKVFLPHNTCKTLQEFINEKATAILNSIGCETTCQQCTDSIGTWENYRQKFMRKLNIPNTDSVSYRDAAWQSYQSEVQECDALCDRNTLVNDILNQMLDDVTPPAGQYANDASLGGSGAYKWSIFHTDFVNSDKQRYQLPAADYLEPDGTPSLINGVKPQELSAEEFSDNFNASWAKSLLPLHPEYKRYLRLLKFKNSLAWDEEFNKTETYADALAKGYLNPTANTTPTFTVFDPSASSGIIRDPFYQICSDSFSIPVSTNKLLMENYMRDISSGSVIGGIAIWNMATISAKCKEGDAVCQNTYRATNAFNTTLLCTGDLDMAWKAYQTMYAARKNKLMYDIVAKAPDGTINPAVPNPNITGDDELHVLNIQASEDYTAASGIGGSASNGQQFQDNGLAQAQQQVSEACQSYVTQWMKDLGTCNYTPAQKTALTDQLLAVCRAGGDATHPMGASTVAPTSTYTLRSFDQVVKDFNSANGITTNINCNADLITAPLPYDAQAAIMYDEEILTGSPEPCFCEKLNGLYSSYTVNSLSTANFSEYLKVRLNITMAESDLTKLRNLCVTANDASCNNLSEPITIPMALQCESSTCINCSEMQQYYNDFKFSYPGVTIVQGAELSEAQQTVNKVFVNFMNKRTGLNKTVSEYLSFMATCSTNTNVSASCDSMADLLASFKDFYSNIDFSQIYQNWKITSCANKLLDATNALIIANNNPVYSILGTKGYARAPYSNKFDVKLKSVTTNAASGFDAANTFNNAILPLDLDCSILPLSTINNSFSEYNILKLNVVYGSEFVLGTAPANQLGNKPLFAVPLEYHNEYLKMIFADKIGSNNTPAFDYNAYGTPAPISKYVFQNANSGLEGHLYDFAVINPLPLNTTPAQYNNYYDNYFDNNQIVRYAQGDPIHAYRYSKGIPLDNVKRLYNIRFDNNILSQTNIPTGDISTKYLICTAEYNDNTTGTVYLYSHNQPGRIAYKEQIDTNLYNPDCQKAFTAYYNHFRGTSYTYQQIDSLYFASCGISLNPCAATESGPTLCATRDTVPPYNPPSKCDLAVDGAVDWGTLKYNEYVDSLSNVFEERYLAKCMNIMNRETFTMSDSVSEYHYTLYYYDQAGNLVKTVPPEGVNLEKMNNKLTWSNTVKAARANGDYLPVLHGVKTQYRYNTLNQVVQQSSPDGGVSNFWYDRLGRLAASQNAKQKAASGTEAGKNYSYTLYDGIGRITEVGEYTNPGSTTMSQQLSRDITALNNWLGTNANKKQVTRTVYDNPNTNWGGITVADIPVNATNLRNRVAYTQYYPLGNPNGINYSQATYYSYDIHGNVDTLIQDYGNATLGTGYVNIMNNNGFHNRFKRMVYQYDLISGKVNNVAYQPQYIKDNILYRPSDALYHRYDYDAENKIVAVYTSTDSLVWENDAAYQYYKHGPLARTELGEQKVQGIDYAYTIQGWLKGVNSSSLTETKDIGEDGSVANAGTRYIARDVYGYSLNYFNGDYTSIQAGAGTNSFPLHTVASGISGGISSADYRALYNGNISSMIVNIGKLTIPDAAGTGVTNGAILYNYTYDQLNRLTAMDAYKGLTAANNSWANIIALQQYRERITYDGNGNIITYKRNGNKASQLVMDDLSYSYNLEAVGAPVRPGLLSNNKLRNVRDAMTVAAAYDEGDPATAVSDIEDQNGATDNYTYDLIGNLIKDDKENITLINWNVYGKISDINFAFSANKPKKITYSYDAAGNRIAKQVEKYGATANATDNPVSYTWYTRDASGNVMAIYNSKTTGTANVPVTLGVIERNLYGSSRLGILSQATDVRTLPNNTAGTVYSSSFTRGNKYYELSNHLGNVLVTISDRKNGVPNAGNTAIDYYIAEVITANDYYPFGMQMPGRKYPTIASYTAQPVTGGGTSATPIMVYKHSFDVQATGHPYTVTPDAQNYVSNSVWSNSRNAWYNFTGYPSSTNALAVDGSPATGANINLDFDINADKILNITSFSFYHRSSPTGYSNWSLLINGVTVGSGTINKNTTGNLAFTGTITIPANAASNLTGHVILTLVLSNSTGSSGTFRFDQFTLNGFVMQQPEIPGSSSGTDGSGRYRYGFNGKEKSNETYGEGNEYDYGFRIYNPRLGKFLSIDPLTDKYPFYTPYQFAGNSPILSLDIDGLEGDKNKNKTETSITIKVGTNKADAEKLGSSEKHVDAMLMAANFVPTWQKEKVDRDIASGAQQPKLALTDAQLTKFAATVMAESGNGMSFRQKLIIASVYYNRIKEQGFENGLNNSCAYAVRFTSEKDGRQHYGKPNGWVMSMLVGMGDPTYANEPIPLAEQAYMTVGGKTATTISAYNATPSAQEKINDAIALKGMLKQTLFSNYFSNPLGSGFLSQGYTGDMNLANDKYTNWSDARAYYHLQEQGKVSDVLVVQLTISGKGTTFIFDNAAIKKFFQDNPGMKPENNPKLKGEDFKQ